MSNLENQNPKVMKVLEKSTLFLLYFLAIFFVLFGYIFLGFSNSNKLDLTIIDSPAINTLDSLTVDIERGVGFLFVGLGIFFFLFAKGFREKQKWVRNASLIIAPVSIIEGIIGVFVGNSTLVYEVVIDIVIFYMVLFNPKVKAYFTGGGLSWKMTVLLIVAIILMIYGGKNFIQASGQFYAQYR